MVHSEVDGTTGLAGIASPPNSLNFSCMKATACSSVGNFLWNSLPGCSFKKDNISSQVLVMVEPVPVTAT